MNYRILLETILTHMEEGIIAVDLSGDITLYKEPKINSGGIDPKVAVGKNVLEVFPDLTTETSCLYSVLKNRKPILNNKIHYTTMYGKNQSMLASTFPIFENNKLVGCFEVFKDLTEVTEMYKKILMLEGKLQQQKIQKKKYIKTQAKYTFESIIGESSKMKTLINEAKKIGNSDSAVLVYGETGTGKELLVHSIHDSDLKRRNKPFIIQNCAALPYNLLESILFGSTSGSFTGAKNTPGLFELADEGTLFLDEINSLDLELQSKLLRVLEDGVIRRIGDTKTKLVDVRIIASINVHPEKLLKENLMREDLFYRLNVIYFEIPPLRERKEDIVILIDHFIKKNNYKMGKSVKGISEEALNTLLKHNWPGNIRELKYYIERVMTFIQTDTITIKEVEDYLNSRIKLINEHKEENNYLTDDTNLKQAVNQFEMKIISKFLEATNGNISEAAKKLNIPKQTLHNKVKKYNI